MSHVLCGVFLNVLALPLSIGTCGGVGMLGIDWMKHKISLVGFYCCCCCCCFFIFAPLALLVSDMLLGGQGGVGF